MPPPLEFSHIGFFVTDLDKTQDFYTRVLGFPITDEGLLGTQRLTFLSRNPKEHHQVVLVEGCPRTLPFNVINQISWMKGGAAKKCCLLKKSLDNFRGGKIFACFSSNPKRICGLNPFPKEVPMRKSFILILALSILIPLSASADQFGMLYGFMTTPSGSTQLYTSGKSATL